jgi:hypothetical protein
MKKTMKMRKARSHRKNKNQKGGIFGFSQVEKDEKEAMGIISQFPENKREQMKSLWSNAKSIDTRKKNDFEKKGLLKKWNQALEFIKSNPDQYAQLQEAEKRREAAIKEGEQLKQYDATVGRTFDDSLNEKYKKGVESLNSLAMYLIDNSKEYNDAEKNTMKSSLNTITNQTTASPDKIADDINELILIWKSKNLKELTDLTNKYRSEQSEKDKASQKELENKLSLALNSGRIHEDSRRRSQGAGGSKRRNRTKRYKRVRSRRLRK